MVAVVTITTQMDIMDVQEIHQNQKYMKNMRNIMLYTNTKRILNCDSVKIYIMLKEMRNGKKLNQ